MTEILIGAFKPMLVKMILTPIVIIPNIKSSSPVLYFIVFVIYKYLVTICYLLFSKSSFHSLFFNSLSICLALLF